jgi:hypothetical protein
MKTTSLLLIVSLAVLTSSASAASNQSDTDLVVLPTYTVTAPRYQAVELQINASLQEFSRQAGQPMVVAPEITLPQAQSGQHQQVAHVTRVAGAGHVAKS